MSYPIAPGGLAAVLAHPDDESFGCAGALSLAHDAGATTRLLVVTRGEAGSADGQGDPALGDQREAELICSARAIGLDEVSLLDGYPDGGVADQPFDRLVDEIAAWLADRRPAAVITFGPHGVTGHPDHIVVGSATRWAVERLSESRDRTERGLCHQPDLRPQRDHVRPLRRGAGCHAPHRDHGGRRAQGRRARVPRQPVRRCP